MAGLKRKNRFDYDENDFEGFESMFLSLGDRESNYLFIGNKTSKQTATHSFSQNDTQIAKVKARPYSALFCVIKSVSKLKNEAKLILSLSQQHQQSQNRLLLEKTEIFVVLNGEWVLAFL